jgi:ADP-heptose:LPS heptosyltransferase
LPSATRRSSTRLRLLRLAGAALAVESRRYTSPPAIRRALLVRPDHVGDVLLTSPAVSLLTASLPSAAITYLVGPWSVAAARAGPPVGAVHTLTFPGFTRQANRTVAHPYLLLAREASRLRRQHFDLAIVARPDHWWGALLVASAGIPVRVGVDTPETRPFLTHALTGRTDQHAAERALDLVRLALRSVGVRPAPVEPGVTFRLNVDALQRADVFWRDHGLEEKQVVALQPAAGALLKSWPVTRWALLGDSLRARGYTVLLIGAPSDATLLETIHARMAPDASGVCLAHGQPLDVSAAMYRRTTVLVAPDSGAAHLAAAVGVPTVRLYGPASASRYGPWPAGADQHVLSSDRLSCVPCGHLEAPPCRAISVPACMLALDAAAVLNVVEQVTAHG